MDDIAETYQLQTIEQMRTVADPLRIRIFEALAQRAMTATQVGEELDIPAPKAHYHVRELERIGLVKLVETRERSGILEKYYRAVARNLQAPPQLLQSSDPGEIAGVITEMFSGMSQSFLTALRRVAQEKAESFDSYLLSLGGDTVWMTPAEFQKTVKAAGDLFAPFRQRRGIAEEREAQVMIIGYDTQLAVRDERDEERGHEPAQEAPMSTPHAQRRVRPVTVVGAVTYSRSELEQVVAAGQRLDLNVSGFLAFAFDIPPELVDQAIERLRYRGILSARSDVREVLRRKER
ncbi:MAG TPA: helix-turn-helix domain-containing protein [Ktedonobacterales bacterium]